MGGSAATERLESDASGDDARTLPVDVAPREPLIELPDCDWEAVHALERGLGIASVVAQTLVRRGHTTESAVRAWISEGAIHPAEQIPGGQDAAAVIAAHLRLGSKIAVHGDYDVDGVCSTAILVRTLAALGADVTWHVPSRFEDGYGLTRSSVDRLAAAGAELIVTVDCGIGSVDEVAHAKSLGLDVVICDHHVIGPVLPAAPVVHPALGGYSDPWLCAAATTFKLAELVTEQAGGDRAAVAPELALVGLATVCDVVPLRGENRALVRAGIEAMRSSQIPGLRELFRVAGIDQLRVSAESFGFGLGPRINAAGRMHSAEPAVELLLTTNEERAAELAKSLGAANQHRRDVEQDVLREADAQARSQRDQFAIVVAGEGWHPGVLGIVAGRIAERYRRPVIALTIDADVASGSARAGGAYDLQAGLGRCSDLLNRFGGHKAAAGLELDRRNLGEFHARFAADAAERLTADDLRPQLRIDAVAGPTDINLEVVAQLEALGPFGAENPQPQLMLAGVELLEVAPLGRTGDHFKLTVAGGAARAKVVAFRQERAIDARDLPRVVDLVVELQRNEFNGREEAQAVLRSIVERDASSTDVWRRSLERALADAPFAASGGLDQARTIDRRGRSLVEVAAEFGAGGGRVCLAVGERSPLLADPTATALDRLGHFVVCSYDDSSLADVDVDAIVMVDPPPAPGFIGWSEKTSVMAWSAESVTQAIEVRADLLLSREHVVAVFRALKASDQDLGKLIAALEVELPSARIAARALQTLDELDIVSIERSGSSVDAFVVHDMPKTDLDRSMTFRSYSGYREESEEWLRQLSAEINSR